MMKRFNSPFEYEEVFNLILSLVKQVKGDIESNKQVSSLELENYFYRLTKGSLGENEFIRRMAFDEIPVYRLAALPILWKQTSINEQLIAPDFIIKLKEKIACVEVKNYDWQAMTKKLKIDKKSFERCRKFKESLKFNMACIAIKRLQKWYLLDIDMIQIEDTGPYYQILIEDANKCNLLNEDLVVFDTGNYYSTKYMKEHKILPPKESKKEGIIYTSLYKNKKIVINKELRKPIKIRYGTNFQSKIQDYNYPENSVILIIHEIIEENFRKIFSNGFQYDKIHLIEDCLPTKFTVTDRLRGKSLHKDVEGIFNRLENDILYIGRNDNTRYYAYCIAVIIWKNYSDKLKKLNVKSSIKDVGTIIKDVEQFKKVFKKNSDNFYF
ncbi:MAG: hypothetical protein EAX96_09895 [Candidatus Lokiarchaeota archaeon]|nr:hypothetical protein [Candidatus Lokiarchaeota archaeon]